MAPSALDSYLLGNKIAVKTGIKISISIWGALFIALLMNFEHPVWAMITGMVSFFAPDHAQVLKKCLFQCFSTIIGGILGVILMGFFGQSPLIAALSVALILFAVSALSYHTRDANVTFCCAIFSVTICIMVMVTVTLTPTSEEIYAIFVDRIGTIIAGIVWAAFVSACVWPVFSSDLLRQSSGRLMKSVLSLNMKFTLDPQELRTRSSAIYSGIIENADLADHCDFEGAWGRRGANVAREINKLAIQIASESYTLHMLAPLERQPIAWELDVLEHLVDQLMQQPIPSDGVILEMQNFATEVREHAARLAIEDSEVSMLLSKVSELAALLGTINKLYVSLMRSEKVSAEGVRVRRHRQVTNCLITGLRTSVLFLSGFAFWYATDWTYGFLLCVVPIVFSIMLGKLPHPEKILKNVAIGLFVAIPVGMAVNSLLAQAPSAIEILVLTAGFVMFFGLMGLSSLMSFAYSLGFNISFMVLLLPMNVQEIDIGFAIERSVSMGLGTIALAFLYLWLPRKRVLKNPDHVSAVFEHDLARYLSDSDVDRSSTVGLADRVGLVIDKMVYISIYEAPEKKAELIEQAGRAIFLMSQVRHVTSFAQNFDLDNAGANGLSAWRAELLSNYTNATNNEEFPLDQQLGRALQVTNPFADESLNQNLRAHFGAMDRLTRRIFA